MESLYQKTFLLKKTFTFLENGLDITTKNSKGESTIFINFDRTSKRGRLRVTITKKPYVVRFGLIFLLLTLSRLFAKNSENSTEVVITVLLIAALIGLATFILYRLTTLKYYAIDLEDGKIFFVIYNAPDKQTVNEFIDEIYERRNKYYKDKYFKIDYDNARNDELNKMNWLKSEGIISENEFNVVLDEINENLQ